MIEHQNEPTLEISEHVMVLGHVIHESCAPGCDSDVDTKLSWLRSQIIGDFVEIQTPFGARMLTYADHTASGRCLRYIEDYIIQNVLPFYGNTHTCDNYVGYRTMQILNQATKFVKNSLGGTQNDALLFCGSGTTAAIKRLQQVLGISVPSILRERVLSSCIVGEERWVVFVGPYEHHSNLLSWRQSLAQVVEIGLDKRGMIDMDDLESRLEFYQHTGRPMLGSFSACSNVTGVCSDTRSLAYLLHKYGALACFDFAASGPYVEIDMRSRDVDGYDAIMLSPHKFLGGPGSPGILLLSKALYQLKNAPPSTCGGGTVNYVNFFNEQDTLYINDIEEREDAGTPQIIQRVKAALAFQIKEYIGCEAINNKEVDYIRRAQERLVKHPNIWLLGNTKVEKLSILSFLLYTTTSEKPLNGAFVATLLNDLFGIQARGGCACAGPYGHSLLGINEGQSLAIRSAVEMGYNGAKMGWTRVSFPYYMSNEEFEFILAAIEFVADYGQRFLPLYRLNWKTGSWSFNTNDILEETLHKQKDCKLCGSFFHGPKAANAHQKVRDCKILNEYALYLEVAEHIGNILIDSPSQRTFPKDIDSNCVFFQV